MSTPKVRTYGPVGNLSLSVDFPNTARIRPRPSYGQRTSPYTHTRVRTNTSTDNAARVHGDVRTYGPGYGQSQVRCLSVGPLTDSQTSNRRRART
jgi:hypothetical protein